MRAPLVIDSKQLTVGLVDVVLPVGGVMMSVAGSLTQQVFVDTNSPTMGYNKSQRVPAKSYVAASTQYSLRTGLPAPMASSSTPLKELSVLVLWTTPAALIANSTIFGYGSSASVTPFVQAGLGASSKFGFFIRATAGTQVPEGTITISANTDYCLIGARSENMNFHRSYVNGVVDINTTATATTTAAMNRATVAALQRTTLGGVCGGQVALVLVWSRALTPTEVAALSTNPWQVFAQPSRRSFAKLSSTTNYSMNASPGSYLVSGVATRVTAARVLLATPGSYAITGAAARLTATRVLLAGPGSYAITGAAANLILNSGGSTYTLNADPGSYAITGAAARLTTTRVLNANAGSYFVTGQAASLVKVNRYILQANAGSYSITGSGAILSPSGSGPTATSDIYLWMRRNLRK